MKISHLTFVSLFCLSTGLNTLRELVKWSKLPYICQLTTIGVSPLEVQHGIMRQDGPELDDKQAYCTSLYNSVTQYQEVWPYLTHCTFKAFSINLPREERAKVNQELSVSLIKLAFMTVNPTAISDHCFLAQVYLFLALMVLVIIPTGEWWPVMPLIFSLSITYLNLPPLPCLCLIVCILSLRNNTRRANNMHDLNHVTGLLSESSVHSNENAKQIWIDFFCEFASNYII